MLKPYAIRNTHQLKQGDVVHCHGHRCLIDSEIKTSQNHPTVAASPTLYVEALVLDREVSDVIPNGWTLQPDGTHRWTIQGNKLALWAVEV